jgi:hypothetical protein
MANFPEGDWKLFKSLMAEVHARYCRRVLSDVAAILETDADAYDRCSQISVHTASQMKRFEALFGQLSRGAASQQLVDLRLNELITDEEYGRFTAETRSQVDRFVESYRTFGAKQSAREEHAD